MIRTKMLHGIAAAAAITTLALTGCSSSTSTVKPTHTPTVKPTHTATVIPTHTATVKPTSHRTP